MSSTLKILLLGDYSNCHVNLASGLKKMGHEVRLMSNVNYLSSGMVDIDTTRAEGKLNGLFLYLKALIPWHKYMKGNDIVAINDPNFLSLRPERLWPIFERLKKENGAVFYTAMSMDVNYIQMCEAPNSPLKFNEWFVEGKPSAWQLTNMDKWKNWHNPELVDYQNCVFDDLNGAVSVLYEYHVGLQQKFNETKIGYGGIPIKTSEIPFIGPVLKDKIRILLCRDKNRIKLKGSDVLEEASKILIKKYPDDLELSIAENLPFGEFIEEIKRSDIVLDQAYSYTPATTALLAMAMGKTVVSGAEPEYYDFIGELENHPIINATYKIEDLVQEFEKTLVNKNFIKENAENSRRFVEKHNDELIVANRFVECWTRNL